MLNFLMLWFASGVFFLTVEWIRGWPNILRDKEKVFRAIEVLKKSNPEKNPRLIYVKSVGSVFLLLGPLFIIFAER